MGVIAMGVTFELSSGWLRLEFFLPANTSKEVRAIQYITAYLNKMYRGSTHSTVRPPVFRGWYEDGDGNLIPDSICLLLVMVKADLDHRDVEDRLRKILMLINEKYKKAESPQDEIWMVTNTYNVFSMKNK